MFRTFLCVLLALAASSGSLAQENQDPQNTATAAPSAFDEGSFAAELRRIGAILEKKPSPGELVQLRDSLPRYWVLSTSSEKYLISSEPLRNELLLSDDEKALVWVKHLKGEVEASAVAAAHGSEARTELQQILARREFGAVRPPSAWDLFRERLSAWFQRLLMKLFGGMMRYPIAGKVIFWLVLVAGAGLSAMWLIRFFAGREKVSALPVSQSIIATRTWQDWIRSAREAASFADYREAVHCSYWAGIARLEEAGVVPKDRSKTPREYLQMVVAPARGQLAAVPVYREAMTGLTRRFERVWYANRGAGLEDYRESLRQLEALGCPLE